MTVIIMIMTGKVGGGADLLPPAGHQRDASAQGVRTAHFTGENKNKQGIARFLSVGMPFVCSPVVVFFQREP